MPRSHAPEPSIGAHALVLLQGPGARRHTPGMRRTWWTIAAGVTGALVLSACGTDAAQEDHRSEVAFVPVSLQDAGSVGEVVAANDRIGLVALAHGDRAGNTVVSPFSLVVALSMLGEGARGTTAAAFDVALGATGQERTDAVSALRLMLLEHDGDPADAAGDELPEAPLLHLASRIVLDEDFVPEPDYLDALARGYDAGVAEADLGSSSGIEELSRWIDQETGGLIEESAIEPSPNLRLVLQDVVVLAARWRSPFDPDDTRPREFHAPSGTVSVDMMSGYGSWPTAQVDGWQAVRLPYVEAFAADLLLPPQGTDPADITPDLLAELTAALGAAQPEGPLVILPTLDLRPEPLDLLNVIDEIGLGVLMASPDLSGISTTTGLELAQAAQQTVLRLDEEGTVAAAVTELAVADGAAPPPPVQLVFDRPFLVRIEHEETDLTLFLAAVREPAAE